MKSSNIPTDEREKNEDEELKDPLLDVLKGICTE